ncbi:hypothetical protein DL96DRAFT_1277213 [Flagelloscypha sp. PMI_526]|nr:hypothetical protein DL96DRAFT_1277213 [Flagelloscypha sp. PMI_526]
MSTINSQRASLKAEIATLETRLLELRSQLNSLSPVNRISTDILLEIFSLVRGNPDSNFGWIRGITDVCSYWRSTALRQRELWATIFLFKNRIKLKTPIYTLIERANGYPLMVHARSSVVLVSDGVFDSVGIHSRRLRGLRLEMCDDLTHLSQFFRVEDGAQAPLLQTLRIDSCAGDFQSMPALTTFLCRQCPSLRELCIPGLFFGPTDLQALNLTDLSLFGGSTLWNNAKDPTIDGVVKVFDILASLTNYNGLRCLILEGTYLDYYEKIQSSQELALPSLRSMIIDNATIRSALNVLRSITCNSAVEISCVRLRTGDDGKHTDSGATELGGIVQLMLQFCQLQGSHLFVDRFMQSGYYEFGLRLEENTRILFHLSISSTAEFARNYDNERHLFSSILGPLDPSPFSHVTFTGGALRVADLSFFCVSQATTITAEPWGSNEGFSLATPPGVSVIPFPRLKAIQIVHLDGWIQALGLTSTLWWRHRRGLSLPRLVFVKYEKREIDETSRALLPLITNGTFLTEPSGEVERLPIVDVELDEESDFQEYTDEDEDVESETEIESQYRSWILRPDEPLCEEEDSSDDYAPPGSDDDYESDWDSDLEEL